MTVQHQSYLELKEDTDEEFARRALLYNLKCLKNNVRATNESDEVFTPYRLSSYEEKR